MENRRWLGAPPPCTSDAGGPGRGSAGELEPVQALLAVGVDEEPAEDEELPDEELPDDELSLAPLDELPFELSELALPELSDEPLSEELSLVDVPDPLRELA